MENEEIFEVSENTEIYSEVIPEEIFEENHEEITESISESNLQSDVINNTDDNVDVDLPAVDTTFEELLKEYIKSSLQKESDSEDGTEEGSALLGSTEEPEETVIDYTDILTDIQKKSEDIYNTDSEIYLRSVENDSNNTLSSNLEDISLTNFLLLALFVATLFTGVINFSRRLF